MLEYGNALSDAANADAGSLPCPVPTVLCLQAGTAMGFSRACMVVAGIGWHQILPTKAPSYFMEEISGVVEADVVGSVECGDWRLKLDVRSRRSEGKS